jgi:hypothetical protein
VLLEGDQDGTFEEDHLTDLATCEQLHFPEHLPLAFLVLELASHSDPPPQHHAELFGTGHQHLAFAALDHAE